MNLVNQLLIILCYTFDLSCFDWRMVLSCIKFNICFVKIREKKFNHLGNKQKIIFQNRNFSSDSKTYRHIHTHTLANLFNRSSNFTRNEIENMRYLFPHSQFFLNYFVLSLFLWRSCLGAIQSRSQTRNKAFLLIQVQI